MFKKIKKFIFGSSDMPAYVGHCAYLPKSHNPSDDMGYYGRYKLISGKFRKRKGMIYPITDKVILIYTRTPSNGSMYSGKDICKIILLKHYEGKNKLIKL